jgi:hypothetical protein
MSATARHFAIFILAAIAGFGIVFIIGRHLPPPSTQPSPISTPPASAPAPATLPTPKPIIQTYGQLLHSDLPNYPDTRPFDTPMDITDAAHVVLREPVYVCPRGDLWISRPDADPLPTVLARAADETEHVTNESVQYVLWTLDQKGNLQAQAVCQRGQDFFLVSATDQKPIPRRKYDWSSATNFDDDGTTRIFVPADNGVSVITIGQPFTESFQPLTDSPTTARPSSTQILRDSRGYLAWIPAEQTADPHTKVARFVDGHWSPLDPTAWPPDIIQLIPMADGATVLQIRRGLDSQTVQFTLATLDKPNIDEKEIDALTQQLGDDDPDKRTAAFAQLSQYGPVIFPLLQKLQPDAAPEAQARIAELLEGNLANNLGGMLVNDNQLSVVTRLTDGGVIFSAPHGVTIPQGQQPPLVINPDYLSVRPGQVPQSLPDAINHEMDATKSITAIHDEWVITRPDKGPERFLPPDRFVPLLRNSERRFSQFINIDGRGRWLFRAPNTQSPTLILDPNIPDATPRLALWLIDTGTNVGWNKDNWPVIVRGNDHWLLTDHDWQLMKPDDPMLTDPGPPTNTLLTDSAGNRFSDGRLTLNVQDPTGQTRSWPLPQDLNGSDDFRPWLAACPEGQLLLVNSIGRIIRLRPTAGPTPFTVEANFDRNIAFIRDIRRVWTDPAGRIAVAYAQSHLAIIFPTGQIPPASSDQILEQNLLRLDASDSSSPDH